MKTHLSTLINRILKQKGLKQVDLITRDLKQGTLSQIMQGRALLKNEKAIKDLASKTGLSVDEIKHAIFLDLVERAKASLNYYPEDSEDSGSKKKTLNVYKEEDVRGVFIEGVDIANLISVEPIYSLRHSLNLDDLIGVLMESDSMFPRIQKGEIAVFSQKYTSSSDPQPCVLVLVRVPDKGNEIHIGKLTHHTKGLCVIETYYPFTTSVFKMSDVIDILYCVAILSPEIL